jgi:hypothetical protein
MSSAANLAKTLPVSLTPRILKVMKGACGQGVSGTLIPETVRASLTALDTKYDGNVDNVTSGNKVNGFDRQGLRAKVLVTPNSDLDITLVADYLRSNSSPTFVAPQIHQRTIFCDCR